MLEPTHRTLSKLHHRSAPCLEQQSANRALEPVEQRAAGHTEKDRKFGKTVKALAALALTMAPQAGQAFEAAEVAETESVQTDDTGFLEPMKAKLDSLQEGAKGWTDRLEYKGAVGEYDLGFKVVDLDLKPRWKDGGPALKFQGDLLETRLSKTDDVGNGWTRRQGVSGKIRGEVSTYDDPSLDLQTSLFREYRGQVGESFDAKFSANASLRHRFYGKDEGCRIGVSFRQEIEGGDYQLLGQDFSLYAEGRQSIFHNLDSDETNMKYSFMVGPKKDIDVCLFGVPGKLTVTAGPEVKGSSQGEAIEAGLEAKVRARFPF
jgi:hypothetical protein